ncbi:MAG: hypothetical protein KF770_10685 [Anaerolineae bacterium]|nr:hypothetical protein [Anaerolineae bacterium]
MALKWMGEQVGQDLINAIAAGVVEFGLTHETEAKRELTPGRGVLTGTLRRSIHAANPSYNFASDDVPPSPGSPERGGRAPDISKRTVHIHIAVGSGMRYAMAIERLYGYITNSHSRVIGRLPDIIRKHTAARGF